MLTHFAWLPKAATHDGRADDGGANCPGNWSEKMPLQELSGFLQFMVSNLENHEVFTLSSQCLSPFTPGNHCSPFTETLGFT